MGKKRLTKSDKERFSKLSSLGCIICKSPAEIHHLTGAGMGMKSSHDRTIPLCHRHHRTGGYGVAVHAGQAVWEEKFGTQEELLVTTNGMLLQLDSGEIHPIH